MIDQPYQYVGRLGYYTHTWAPDFGLLQLGVRFYDPEVGRLAQIDAARLAGVSPYVYVRATPTVLIDPTGKYIEVCRFSAPYVHQFICYTVGGRTKCAGFNNQWPISPLVGPGCVTDDTAKRSDDKRIEPNKDHRTCYKLTNLTEKQARCVQRRIDSGIRDRPCRPYLLFTYNCRSWTANVVEDCTDINLMPWDEDNPGYWNGWLGGF